jgi:ubiquinone/menaquinone biosynthesis C-methylase UbiE
MREAWRRLIGFGFRLLYHEMAWSYDWVSQVVSGGEWRAWMRCALQVTRPQAGERVIEIAHGTGVLQADLAALGCEAFGVDFSPQMGLLARNRTNVAGFAARLVRAKAQALPVRASTFDVLICTFPSAFVLELETLREFRRVLKGDGRGVVVLHGALTRGGWWMRAMDGLFRGTGQGKVLVDEMPSQEALSAQYQPFLALFAAAGLDAVMVAVPTSRGFAVTVQFASLT